MFFKVEEEKVAEVEAKEAVAAVAETEEKAVELVILLEVQQLPIWVQR